jgi:hypothetical protein
MSLRGDEAIRLVVSNVLDEGETGVDCSASLVHCNTVQETLTIRIDASLKQAAERVAAENDDTLSQVIRRALREYVSSHSRTEIQSGTSPHSSRQRN